MCRCSANLLHCRSPLSFIFCASSASITRERTASRRTPAFSSHLIYKRECQGKYSSLDRKRGTFLAFQPLSAMRDARLCCLAPCPWVLAIVPSRQLHLYLVATTPISL